MTDERWVWNARSQNTDRLLSFPKILYSSRRNHCHRYKHWWVVATEWLFLAQYKDAVRIWLWSTIIEEVFERCDERVVVKQTRHTILRRLDSTQLHWFLSDVVNCRLLVVEHSASIYTRHKSSHIPGRFTSVWQLQLWHHHHHSHSLRDILQ